MCTLVNSNINIGLLTTTDVQFYCHMLIIGEPGWRVYENSLLSVHLRLPGKNNGYQNKVCFQHGLLSVPQILHPMVGGRESLGERRAGSPQGKD